MEKVKIDRLTNIFKPGYSMVYDKLFIKREKMNELFYNKLMIYGKDKNR